METMVAECTCGEAVPPTAIHRVRRVGKQVLLMWQHDCGHLGETRLSWGEYRKLVAAHARAEAEHQMPINTRDYDPEWVGRVVQGFRIDLDVVYTVADMELFWNDQERWALDTVPRER